MASVFKTRTTRYVDDKGRQVKKGTPGAQIQRQKSRKWYGQYKDEGGILRRVALSSDKSASQTRLNELVKAVERKQAGLFDEFEEHEKKPLSKHLADYRTFLLAKGDSEQHAEQTVGRITRLLDGCEFRKLSDVNAPAVAEWLATCRSEKKRFSLQTSNYYLIAVKAFFAWLTEHGRINKNPLSSLKRLNAETDRRHERRPLSEDEFQWLVSAAESGPVIEGVSGRDRAMLYVLSAWTGFRKRELSSLTLESIDLDGEPPSLRVAASYSKRRRNDEIPLHPNVADRLRAWLSEKNPKRGDPLFKLQPSQSPVPSAFTGERPQR